MTVSNDTRYKVMGENNSPIISSTFAMSPGLAQPLYNPTSPITSRINITLRKNNPEPILKSGNAKSFYRYLYPF